MGLYESETRQAAAQIDQRAIQSGNLAMTDYAGLQHYCQMLGFKFMLLHTVSQTQQCTNVTPGLAGQAVVPDKAEVDRIAEAPAVV
jgi:hypothetical protein